MRPGTPKAGERMYGARVIRDGRRTRIPVVSATWWHAFREPLWLDGALPAPDKEGR